jgi:LPXTG-site transpeptidase (sortase) family protein
MVFRSHFQGCFRDYFHGHKGALLGNLLLAILTIVIGAPGVVARDNSSGDFSGAQETTAIEMKIDAGEMESVDAGILFEVKGGGGAKTAMKMSWVAVGSGTSAETAKRTTAQSIKAKIEVAQKPDEISILGRTVKIKKVADTKVNAGNMVALYGDGFLYGHNTNAVFGVLSRATTGTNFSVTLNNETKSYRIAKTAVLTKEDTKKSMYSLAKTQSFDGENYDLVLMTCAGRSVGHSDATHRRIVLANRV